MEKELEELLNLKKLLEKRPSRELFRTYLVKIAKLYIKGKIPKEKVPENLREILDEVKRKYEEMKKKYPNWGDETIIRSIMWGIAIKRAGFL